MNIENIVLLGEMLKQLGFDEALGYDILKQACFHSSSIVVRQRMEKGRDVISFQILFERNSDSYHFKYYDASLRKALEISDAGAALDKKMATIDWVSAFDQRARKVWMPSDTSSWKSEANVAAVIKELEAFEDAEDAIRLKVKYWGDIEQSMFNLASMKAKFEISQRFYFFEEQGCIGADEAYRFLHNRWLEKQMLMKKRTENSADPGSETVPAKGGLLQKKRGGGKKKSTLL